MALATRRAVSSLGVLCVLVAGCVAATAEIVTGIVVGIADGDTITVLDEHYRQHKIRLAGIDAPEKRQDFGNRSKQSLSDLAYRTHAAIESDKTDRYGRRVGKVIVNGLDVNLEQVRRGMAWHYRAYVREQSPDDRKAYAETENAARAARRGLWSMPGPVAPWEFRRSGKTAAMGLAAPAEGVAALRNPGRYRSVSALSPIVAPSQVPWGRKAFEAYLGADRAAWTQWDTVELLKSCEPALELLVDQGGADEFLAVQLRPELLQAACDASGHALRLRVHEGYDHSYYFIATFLGEHFAHHAALLKQGRAAAG